MYYYIENSYNAYILIIIILLMPFLYYIEQFIQFKKFAKELYTKDIKFIPFTFYLIKTKIRAIF